jgi:hypothetical protein
MTHGTIRPGLRGADDFGRGKQLIAEGNALLNAYVRESPRADKRYPMLENSDEETRKPEPGFTEKARRNE